jgi:ankyrin repeat protein
VEDEDELSSALAEVVAGNREYFESNDIFSRYPVELLEYAVRCEEIEILKLFMSISSEACRKRLPDGNTLLTTACTQGREQIVQILLPHVNALETNQDGLTALHCAALAGQLEIVQLLIQENINPNHPTADNQHTAFTLACQEGHLDVVAYFIEEISDILWKNQFGKSAIDYAIDSGSCEVISFLLQQPIAASLGYFEMIRYAISIGKFEVVAHILQSIRETFETPDLPYNPDYSMEFNYCVHAIMISNMELLDCLLQIPSVMEELKVYVAEGNDLLVIPAKENNLSLISYLVEKHQINRLQKYSCGNAFKVACKRGFLEIVQYFAEKCSPAPIYNVDTVFMACKRGHIPVIKYLLESQQFDPTMIDSEHLTLLYYAAQQANLEMVKYLFPFFFPSKTDSWYNIFLWAIQEGHLDLIKSILDRFTSESHSWWSSSTESSPLIQAVTRNQIHVVRYFIEECPSYKNRFSAKDLLKDLNSAMYMAGFRCLIDMSKYLLSVQRGSQTPITILDLFDWSIESGCLPLLKYLIDNDLIKLEGLFEGNFFLPLQHATRTGYLPLVKFFLLKLSELNYAQPDFEDREGTSLMHTACEYGELELVQFYLEEIGMYSPLQPNNRGQIPLIIAIEKAHQDKYFQVAKFLIEILGLEAIEIVDALSCAGTLGNIDLVRMLCPSVTTDEDLVFWAARKGYVQLVKNLVELRGWEAHVLLLINSEDESLLICATKSCKLSVIHYLLETLNCPTDRPVGTNKHTALDWAVKLGHVEAVKLLIEHKALVKPSHVLSACRAGHVPVVRYLLDVCKFTLDDFTGVSPFFKACIGGHIVMVAFLLDRRFVRMDSEELQSALVLACRSGNLDLVKLFLDENWSSPVLASKTFVDTPILPAAEKGFLHIVDYLIVNWKVPITLELIKRSAPTVLRYLFEQALQYLESVEFIIEDREAFLKWEEAMKLIKIPPAFTCFDSRSLLRRLHKIARNAASEWTLRKVLVVGHEGAGKVS